MILEIWGCSLNNPSPQLPKTPRDLSAIKPRKNNSGIWDDQGIFFKDQGSTDPLWRPL